MIKRSTVFTAIAYANAKPHIGHAYEYVLADTIARYEKLIGNETFFCTGMDEHGQKIYNKAVSEGKTAQELVDSVGETFKSLDKLLEVNYDRFIKTTDADHKKVVQDLWMKMFESGDIFEKEYSGLYCVGCESYKTATELDTTGNCLIHLTKAETLKGTNWFFRLSKYEKELRSKIESDEIKIIPENFKTEILSFIEQGLEDISFSRPKTVLTWGIDVPNDPTHVMYVWCDALTNYLTAAMSQDKKFWDETMMVNVIGKDILRFHALYWPAMLMSAGEKLPQNILVHGMILSNGQKMSKTIGNVIDPVDVVKLYSDSLGEKSLFGSEIGSEFFRYFFLKNISPFLDGDFTFERAKELYNADLANGIGNLVSRVLRLSEMYLDKKENFEQDVFPNSYTESMKNFDVKKAFEAIFEVVSHADEYMQSNQPFKIVKVDEAKGKEMLEHLRTQVYLIARLLNPFMPITSQKIKDIIKENKMPEKPLFPRYE
jgi:methionyl-tRNA synthetase